MATLSAWSFDTADGAANVQRRLLELQDANLVTIDDAAVVSWPPGADKPTTHQINDFTPGKGALGGAFWGFLFGLLFFAPIIGAAMGEAIGALVGSLGPAGIGKDFIAKVRSAVTPGTSALFLLTEDAARERLVEELAPLHPQLIETNLDAEQEQKLRSAFS